VQAERAELPQANAGARPGKRVTGQVQVRSATPDDRDGIGNAWKASELGFDAEGLVVDNAEFPIFVAVGVHDEVVGALEGEFKHRLDQVQDLPGGSGLQAWVFTIGVVPPARRQGVGGALLQAFACAAVDAGCTYVVLRVQEDEDMDARLAFFRRCGFTTPYTGDDQNLAVALLTDLTK
jgi:GNAT superfamily N-acetyltransferase